MPFLAPSKLKFFSTKVRVGYVYIKESFVIIFSMGYGGGEGVKRKTLGIDIQI